MQITTINEFANKCGYFYNAELDPEAREFVLVEKTEVAAVAKRNND